MPRPSRPSRNPADDDDLVSYRTLRRVVGLLGVSLPIVLAVWGFALQHRVAILPSLSDYYALRTRDALVGVLFTIAWFLFTYRGYDWRDDLAGNLACVFALGVALFPNVGPWAAPTLHFVSAALLFLVLAYYSLFLFTESAPLPTPEKCVRNRVYVVCGVIMLVCVVGIAISMGVLSRATRDHLAIVFWFETIGLWAFGYSWFVKGDTVFRDKGEALRGSGHISDGPLDRRPTLPPMPTTSSTPAESRATLTYIGGPTALIEVGGVRFITDPTFDPAGSAYPSPTGAYTLEKTMDPAIAVEQLGQIDAVLLSHDHHSDNLDAAGRVMLANATRVLTTIAGAERLGGNATGLQPWESITLPAPDGHELRVTATPARHGPEGGDRGPVIGFVLEPSNAPDAAVYVTGDTVWYDGVAEVAKRFDVATVVAFLGAAHVAVAGPHHLTLTGSEGVEVARAFPRATIVPLHFEGWKHFGEGRAEIERAFAGAGMESRLRWAERGEPVVIDT